MSCSPTVIGVGAVSDFSTAVLSVRTIPSASDRVAFRIVPAKTPGVPVILLQLVDVDDRRQQPVMPVWHWPLVIAATRTHK
jgi:hypothetical protein